MKKLQLNKRFFLKVAPELQNEFKRKIRLDNVERVYILAWIGLAFFFLQLFIDFIRYREGVLQTDYLSQLLFYNHLSMGVLIIPIYIIFRNRAKIKRGNYPYSLTIIYSTFVYIALVVLMLAFLCLVDRNGMMVYGLFIMIINFVVILPHIERIVFNVFSLVIIISAVITIYEYKQLDSILAYVNILECITGTVLAFSLSTFLYNDQLKRFNYERILKEKNNIIKEEKRISNELAEKLEKLNAQKSKLYTNITHEFRTPLTVIMGMSETLRSVLPKSNRDHQEKALSAIEYQSDNMLKLINMMMELSKLESGLMRLDLVQSDVISFLDMVTKSFETYAKAKNIYLRFLTDLEKFEMDFDAQKLQGVLSNLLSNAIKFSSKESEVIVIAKVIKENNTEQILIKVKDNGVGIAENDLANIFNRFYQVDSVSARYVGGSGIGLALTKELVLLMNGQISVSSIEHKGAEFEILLPVTRTHPIETISSPPIQHLPIPEAESEVEHENVILDIDKQKPLLLIVEDTPAVINYLISILQLSYRLIFAYDGQEGIDKAIEKMPDIVLSDIKMPRKNGYELCETLRSDERTNHIPIVLLSAKATEEEIVVGLESGADIYLTKPFNRKKLLIHLRNILARQLNLQKKYKPNNFLFDNSIGSLSAMNQLPNFLLELNSILDKNIGDEDFGIPQLSKAVSYSESQLYRKVKSLTGLPPGQYIRLFRLHKAKGLLKNSSISIAEISYQVGFKSPNYFTRAFREEFEMTPSAMRNILTTNHLE